MANDVETQGLPRVPIFFTGGTISMKVDPALGGPTPALSGSEILRRTVDLRQWADCDAIDFGLYPGPHMTPSLMFDLAGRVQQALAAPDVAGAVITHGTDTLEETAYLLDILIHSPKPIVFVGAMRNSSDPGWDGPRNLASGVRVATAPDARNLGVLIVMNDWIQSAQDGTKTHTESVDTFQARDFGPLGMIEKDRIFIQRTPKRREFFPTHSIEERVEIIKLSAGSNGALLEAAVQLGAKGLVLEGLGRGNAPLPSLPAVRRVLESDVPVVVTSRCPKGRAWDTYAYEGSGRELRNRGAILGGFLPSHKARLKLMVLLGRGATRSEIRAAFED